MGNAKFEAAIRTMNEQRQKSGVNLGGKLYSMVKDRIEIFRREWGDEYGIDTTVDTSNGFDDGSVVVGIAKVISKDGAVLASGWAMEIVGTNDYTTYSPVEVAETSAIGRALACFGLHGGEYASGNEIEKADRHRFEGQQMSNRPHQSTTSPPNGPEQDNIQARQAPPPRQPVEPERLGVYVPEGQWDSPEDEQQRVVAVIESINNLNDLARYWHELKPFMAELVRANHELVAEIKAAFATANHELGGR